MLRKDREEEESDKPRDTAHHTGQLDHYKQQQRQNKPKKKKTKNK